MTQQCLPIEAETLCGYCLHPLTLQPEGDWRCEPCQPGLAKVTGPESWKVFQIAAAKRRPRSSSRRAPALT